MNKKDLKHSLNILSPTIPEIKYEENLALFSHAILVENPNRAKHNTPLIAADQIVRDR